MGLLVNGQWQDTWYETKKSKGEFVRESAKFRDWITSNGQPGPEGQPGIKAEKGRFHLYVSLACPWAHRTLIFRALKNLEDYISVSVVSPYMHEHGWTYDQNQLSTGDSQNGFDFHHQLYTATVPDYTGRVTVPVLWDKKEKRIINNESSEIIRMLNSAFNDLNGNQDCYYPEHLREEIDAVNEWIYSDINNGVYRCGFATTQTAYEKAYHRLFDALDRVENILAKQAYVAGDQITEADWRLFTTLIRFDAVYHGHFKCNRHRLEDYTHIPEYIRELYQVSGIAETVDFKHIKDHYYASHLNINPTGVVPLGPDIDYGRKHKRGDLFSAEGKSAIK